MVSFSLCIQFVYTNSDTLKAFPNPFPAFLSLKETTVSYSTDLFCVVFMFDYVWSHMIMSTFVSGFI